MEKVDLSMQLVNGILQYLGKQPYTDVANLITAIQQEAQASIVANTPNDSTPAE